jgi:hypothetical protein
MRVQRRPPAPVILRRDPRTAHVIMQTESAEALLALVTNEADRATLRSRIVIQR